MLGMWAMLSSAWQLSIIVWTAIIQTHSAFALLNNQRDFRTIQIEKKSLFRGDEKHDTGSDNFRNAWMTKAEHQSDFFKWNEYFL